MFVYLEKFSIQEEDKITYDQIKKLLTQKTDFDEPLKNIFNIFFF